MLIGLLAFSALLGGTLPQTGRLSPGQLQGFQAEWSVISSWLDMLGFSYVFGSWWFFILYIALLGNLAAGTVLSIVYRYRWYQGKAKPAYQFHGVAPALEQQGYSSRWMDNRIQGVAGLWGLPLFHLGIAMIVLGGLWSSVSGFGAHLELSEGELYAGQQEKLAVDRGRSLPAELNALLRLDQVYVELSEHKHLRELQAHFSYQERDGLVKQVVVETNHPLKLGFYELSPNKTGGYSAVFERQRKDGSRRRMFIHFNVPINEWNWNGSWTVQRDILVELDDAPLFYKMTMRGRETPSLDLVVKKGVDIVFQGTLEPGSMADVGPYRLVFMGAVPWLGFYLASDYPKYVVFAGFIVTLFGFLLHLLIYPRRIEAVQEGDVWTVRAWIMPGDWKFDEQWRRWSAQLSANRP